MTSPSAVTRRTVAKGVAWSAPAVALAASAPALAASPEECYVFDMWSSNGRQQINNNRDQISGTVRYSPNQYQDCIADKNQPYPHNIVITVTLDPSVYTGAFEFSGPGTATGSGNVVTITLPFAGLQPGSSGVQWNLYATTLSGVTKEQAQYKASVQAVSYPEAKWVIIEPHNEWMSNRTPLSYVY